MKTSQRIIAAVAGLTATVGIALGAAGAANAGTLPVTHPGEPTTTMTITNRSAQPEFLIGSSTGGTGHWVNGPRGYLAPGATETVTAVAPTGNYLTTNVVYRVGVIGPKANYEVENMKGNVNTAMSGVSGGHHFLNTHVSSGYPNVNADFIQW